MKKLLAVIMALALLCVSAVAFADAAEKAILEPEGYDTQIILDFSDHEGDMLSSEAGFWLPSVDADREVTFENGRVTFYQQNMWGAFFNFTQDEMDLFLGKTGWGFYVKNGEMDTVICAGFNAASTKNYTLDEDAPYMLVDMQGNVTVDVTIWSSSEQGGIIIPYDFEGYVYIPFSAYSSGDGSTFGESDAIMTPIYALAEGEEFTYGEFFVYTSDVEMVPGEVPSDETPTEEPTQDITEAPTNTPDAPAEGSFPIWIIIVAAVVIIAVVAVVIIVASKKKKA